MTDRLRVISLGAGWQSSAVMLLSDQGELLPRADLAIFADTGWEPRAVYAHLELLERSVSIPVERVSAGNIRADALDGSHRFASMPLFTRDSRGKVSMLRRQCTREYKLRPIQRRLRELGATASEPAEVWIGISTDEVVRMKPSRVLYAHNRWPLIELGWDRAKCGEFLAALGWSAPKSSCIGCPFHDDHYWERLRSESSDEFADAVAFDAAIRRNPRLRDETYLHRSAVPLDAAVFDGNGQGDLFANECEGMCGV